MYNCLPHIDTGSGSNHEVPRKDFIRLLAAAAGIEQESLHKVEALLVGY